MDQLIPGLAALVEAFRDGFHPQVFSTFQALIAGWVLCLGPRTLSEVWQATGLAAKRHHDTAYAVFHSAAWEWDDLGLVLATLVLTHLVPGGVVWVAVDDTLCHKRGAKVAFGGIFLDAVLSPKKHKTFRFGLNWVVLGVAVPIPFRTDRYFCLPVLWRLYRKKGQPGHKPRPQSAAELARRLAEANPDRTFWLVGDSDYVNAAGDIVNLGVRSSRQIERLCNRDVAFRVVAGNLRPDHATIARFRQRHGEALKGLFTDILRLCKLAGLVKVGVVALDGTKMAADAALEANRTYGSIRTEVESMLQEAQSTDAAEDRLHGPERRGDELPEALRDRHGRLERLKRCRERLEGEVAAAAADHARKLAERAAKEAETGQKLRGRKPKPVSETPEAEARANVTDPDSRIMKTRRGYVQGYNARAVATVDQIIVAAEVTPEENDANQLHPMLAATANELKAAGVEETARAALVDAGYCSEANLEQADPDGPELFVATRKDWKQREQRRQAPPPRGRIPGHPGSA